MAYTYDALGRRITESDGATHHVAFLHDGGQVLVDWDMQGDLIGTPGTAGILREFVYGPGIDHPARYQDAAGAQFYYHYNSLGSIAALTSATGSGAELVQYGAYGNATVTQTGGLAPTGNPFLFTGRRLDTATGNYYYRARYLDPNLGRFLSRDPLGIWGDPANHGNSYAYCNNNPVNCVDPSGTFVYGKVTWTFTDDVKASFIDVSGDSIITASDALMVTDEFGGEDLGLFDPALFDRNSSTRSRSGDPATPTDALIVDFDGDELSDKAGIATLTTGSVWDENGLVQRGGSKW
jgi:RHS repeat-associated protein